MKQLPPLLFALGYLLGGFGVIWLLVMIFNRGDPKFSEAVGFYYGLWIFFYLPIAIAGTIALTRMVRGFRARMIAAVAILFAVLVAMFISFYFNVKVPLLLAEYLVFGVSFWFLARAKTNTEQAVADQPTAAARLNVSGDVPR